MMADSDGLQWAALIELKENCGARGLGWGFVKCRSRDILPGLKHIHVLVPTNSRLFFEESKPMTTDLCFLGFTAVVLRSYKHWYRSSNQLTGSISVPDREPR
jgi:hypothetical protein